MKIDRLIAIIMILLEHEKVRVKDLAARFEVSSRTIYRDLDTINQAGIPILTTSGPGGGVEILATYKFEKRLFSTADIITLLMGLGSIQCNASSSEMINTLAKVKAMIPPTQQKQFEYHANQIKIDATPWLYTDEVADLIALIKSALAVQQLLQFEYRDIRNKTSVRQVEPYRLLLKGEDWYLQGYCLERADFRTFKLLRMQAVCVLPQKFELREDFLLRLNSAHFNNQLHDVSLRLHISIKDAIVSRFGGGVLTPDGADYYIAKVKMPIDDLACNYLLSFGNKIKCMAPESLRVLLKQVLAELYQSYL